MFKNYKKYEVYDDGRIWSYSHKKWLKPQLDKYGYQRVNLSDNECKRKTYQVHRVVYEAVTGESIPEGMQCNHINEDKTDNRFCNINLLTPKENTNWGTRTERASKAKTNNPKRSKQVGAFKDGELVMTFPSAREAGRQGFHQSNVSSCCRGELKTYKGFEWRYI